MQVTLLNYPVACLNLEGAQRSVHGVPQTSQILFNFINCTYQRDTGTKHGILRNLYSGHEGMRYLIALKPLPNTIPW